MYFDLYILCYISYLSNSRMKTLLSRMSSNRRVKRDDHEPEEEDDEHMGDSEEEAETEFFERNTNEFKCKKGQEQYVYVSKNYLSVKKNISSSRKYLHYRCRAARWCAGTACQVAGRGWSTGAGPR